MNYEKLRNKTGELPSASARRMFGYECFSVNGKFFVGFSKKNTFEVIVRLPRDEQDGALKNKRIKPFSHGTKAGWIDIDTRLVATNEAFKWIKKGYAHALHLSKQLNK